MKKNKKYDTFYWIIEFAQTFNKQWEGFNFDRPFQRVEGYIDGVESMIHGLPDNEDLLKAFSKVNQAWSQLRRCIPIGSDLSSEIDQLKDAIYDFQAEWEMYNQFQHD